MFLSIYSISSCNYTCRSASLPFPFPHMSAKLLTLLAAPPLPYHEHSSPLPHHFTWKLADSNWDGNTQGIWLRAAGLNYLEMFQIQNIRWKAEQYILYRKLKPQAASDEKVQALSLFKVEYATCVKLLAVPKPWRLHCEAFTASCPETNYTTKLILCRVM